MFKLKKNKACPHAIQRTSFYVMLVIAFFQVACSASKKTKQTDQILSINWFFSLPVQASANGDFIQADFPQQVYFYKDFVLFESRDTLDFTLTEMDPDSTITDTKSGILPGHSIFVYQKGQSIGYKYDSLNAKTFKTIVKVDSVLKAMLNVPDRMFLESNDDSLVSIEKGNNYLLKRFITKEKKDISYPDSIYFFYSSNLNDIPYSFSPRADSLYKMKLSEWKAIYNPAYVDELKMNFSRREIIIRMSRKNADNAEQLLRFFENVKNAYDKANQHNDQ